ncbi:MAG TPA: DUF6350 family protein [Actinophytocola sp.]|uniref:cell division protein PerM n=1 Tax=Actinophytocola sp. TaxID=1872138 RepID=UPI002DDD78D1|nr:DUF6350 family protein [Actinophytocola sp.]HEV2779920.1 DUF6350 family protein [Actinophytocola sp.]
MAPLRFGLAATDQYDAVAEFADEYDAVPLAGRVRVLAMITLGPLITGYAAVAAVLALVTAAASKAHFSTAGVLSSAMPGWLAAHQVPLRIEGHDLGALPLLPSIAAVVLLARTASGAAQRLDLYTPAQAGQVVLAITGGHAAFGLALGLLCAGGPATVDPLAAFYYPALLAAAASVAGVARHGGLLELALERVDEVAMRGLRVGVLAVVVLLAAGALALTLGLVTSVPTVRDIFARNASGFGSGLGMLLLSVGYLPNGVIAGTSFVAGSGFAMGEISVAPLDFAGGPVPGLPLLAALPESPAVWWPVLLVLPVAVGVLVGRLLRDVATEPVARLRAVAVATGVVALSFVILAGSAGGPLGGGRFDPVDLRAASLSLALVAWVGLVGAAVAWFGGGWAALDGPSGLLDDAEPDGEAQPEDPEARPEDPEPGGEEPAPAEEGDSPDLADKID